METPQIQTTEEARKEEAVVRYPSLSIDIEDSDLIRLIDSRIKDSEDFYEGKLKLKKRRQRMEEFWLGKQVDESQLDAAWQLPYVDNIIWQDTETRIGLVAAKLPDIIVIPPTDDPVARERAMKIDKGLDIRINNENIRRLIKDGLRDNHLFLIGCVKVRWDENIGENGDFIFEKVNPKKLILDHTATIPHDGYSADNMEFIAEWIEEPVSLVCAKFPDKKEELLKKLRIIMGTQKQMSSKMRYLEIWFTWYDKEGNKQEGVCWKYGKLLLDKMKNPYYDWEGLNKGSKTQLQNFFPFPRKPYIFFNHMNLGNSPIDDTTPVEQSIPLQVNINKRGRQVTEISDNAVPKKVFSGTAITKEEARRVSNDPSEHIWLERSDDVNKAFTTVRSDPPSPLLFDDLVANRGQIDAKFATHSITRGETVAPAASGIAKQITRQGDLQITDDLVETVIVRVITELCGWALQMIKVMYNKDHEFKNMGKDGELTTLTLNQTSVDEGVGLQVRASTSDKTDRQNISLELAKAKVNDPLSLFEDLDVSNPKERTERAITFLKGQMDGYQSYLKFTGLDQDPNMNPEAAGNLANLGKEEAVNDIQSIKDGKPVESKGLPSPEYVQTLIEYVNSEEFRKLSPEIQQSFQSYIQELKNRVSQQLQPPVGGQPSPPAISAVPAGAEAIPPAGGGGGLPLT